jgi:hypothetical protein
MRCPNLSIIRRDTALALRIHHRELESQMPIAAAVRATGLSVGTPTRDIPVTF